MTDGAPGIGGAIARLRARSADVVLTDAANEAGERVAGEIGSAGADALGGVTLDLRQASPVPLLMAH